MCTLNLNKQTLHYLRDFKRGRKGGSGATYLASNTVSKIFTPSATSLFYSDVGSGVESVATPDVKFIIS